MFFFALAFYSVSHSEDYATVSLEYSGQFPAYASPYIGGVRFYFESSRTIVQDVPDPYDYYLGLSLFRKTYPVNEYVDYGLRYGHCYYFPPRMRLDTFEEYIDHSEVYVDGVWRDAKTYTYTGTRNAALTWRWHGNFRVKSGIYNYPSSNTVPCIVQWNMPGPQYLPNTTEYLYANMAESSWFDFQLLLPAWCDSLMGFPRMDPLVHLNEGEWAEWLPGPMLGNDSQYFDPLPFHFQFTCPEAEEWEWDMRVRLFDISMYPGIASNFRRLDIDESFWVPWDDAKHPAKNELDADMRILSEDQTTPNRWDIDFEIDFDADGDSVGHYVANYTSTLRHGDTFSILVSPDDFGGRAKITVEIKPHGRGDWFPIIRRML